MTRHGKNATASSVYSYHERQKDTNQSEYGTQAARVGKDSVKEFDACCLTLQPCKEPMISNEGHIFDKEAILEYIIAQKRKIAKQMKEYEKQKKADKREMKELAEAEQRAKAEKFVASEKSITTLSKTFQNKTAKGEASSSHAAQPDDVSFWIPSHTPAAKKSKAKKPSSKVLCPVSGKPIRFKDLVPVHFTPISDGDTTTSVISKKARWQCAVSHDTLGNSVPCAVMRNGGHVMTMECVSKIVESDGVDPLTGDVIAPRDVIEIQRGGTGFAGTNRHLETKSYRPVMMV